MNEQRLDSFSAYAGVSTVDRNRVLRNTYWLLAVSLVPTVLGAWLGVSTGIMASLGTGMSLILFLGGAFGFLMERSSDHTSIGASVITMMRTIDPSTGLPTHTPPPAPVVFEVPPSTS